MQDDVDIGGHRKTSTEYACFDESKRENWNNMKQLMHYPLRLRTTTEDYSSACMMLPSQTVDCHEQLNTMLI